MGDWKTAGLGGNAGSCGFCSGGAVLPTEDVAGGVLRIIKPKRPTVGAFVSEHEPDNTGITSPVWWHIFQAVNQNIIVIKDSMLSLMWEFHEKNKSQ